jgi:hypothetical protein
MTMKKINYLLALAVLFTATAALAQPVSPPTPVTNVSQFVSADDQGVAILVKYYPGVSTNTSATVAVVQGTSLTFQVAAAAYTGFECPVAGALGGIIDETNASCNTLGEIVDAINSTSETFASGFFRAVIVDGLRADSADDLLADAGTQVTKAYGHPIYSDTSANFAVGETRALLPGDCRTDIKCFVTPAGKLIQNPYFGQQTMVNWVEGYSTYGGGTSGLRIYSVKATNKATGSETATTLWSEAMGASATNKQFTQFQYTPVYGRPNEKVIVRVVNSVAQATAVLGIQARQVK